MDDRGRRRAAVAVSCPPRGPDSPGNPIHRRPDCAEDLGALGGADILSLYPDIRIFITVLAYGAGVDYCIFLSAGYREERDSGASTGDAVANAVGHVGGAICASAATVIGGLTMLAFARFGKIHQAGWPSPLALLIVLAATLTFSAALLCALGRRAFWSLRAEGSSPIESTIKQINQRVKGTEKFWSEGGAEAILQQRADTLSETESLIGFWERRQAAATGQRCYSRAS